MTEDFTYYLQVFSTLSIIIPLIANLLAIKKTASKQMLFFFFFLIIAFLSDLLGWHQAVQVGKCPDASCKEAIYSVMYAKRCFYALIEGVFFIWFIHTLAIGKTIRKLTQFSIWFTLILWLVSIPILRLLLGEANLTLFDTIHSVLASFLASFILLKLIERESQITRNFSFWLLFAIFFYSFCTFFILSLVKSQLGIDLWFLHNYINIITYILYTIGFIQFHKTGQVNSS